MTCIFGRFSSFLEGTYQLVPLHEHIATSQQNFTWIHGNFTKIHSDRTTFLHQLKAAKRVLSLWAQLVRLFMEKSRGNGKCKLETYRFQVCNSNTLRVWVVKADTREKRKMYRFIHKKRNGEIAVCVCVFQGDTSFNLVKNVLKPYTHQQHNKRKQWKKERCNNRVHNNNYLISSRALLRLFLSCF